MTNIQIFPTPSRMKFTEGSLNKPSALNLFMDTTISKEKFQDKIQMMMSLSQNIARGLDICLENIEINLDGAGLTQYLAGLAEKISHLQLNCLDGDLIKKEMALSCSNDPPWNAPVSGHDGT